MVPSQFHPHFIIRYCAVMPRYCAVVPRKLVFLVVLIKQLSDILWNVCNGGYWCLFKIIGTVVFIPKFKTPPLLEFCLTLPQFAVVFLSVRLQTEPSTPEKCFLLSVFCQA